VASTPLILHAPLKGWSTSLEEAPDPVFSGRMLGDGLAIDPTGDTLYAPCDGTLILVATSKHAVTLRAANGADILLHVGIDTVGLGGEGFELHVREGQQVRAADRLISFDLDLLARRARSVLTPVILTDSERFMVARRNEGRLLNVGDFLMEIARCKDSMPVRGVDESTGSTAVARRHVTVPFAHGIHARPAALLAASVKSFSAVVSVIAGARRANAKSPIALMSLGIREGERLVIEASGSDATAAVAALERAFTQSSANSPDGAAQRISSVASEARAVLPGDLAATAPAQLRGLVANRGLAIGVAFQLARLRIDVPEEGGGGAHETAEFDRARAAARDDLQLAAASGAGPAREVAAAHLELIEDPELILGTRKLIAAGKSAGYAWRAVLSTGAESLRALGDPRMAERADDLLDLESRVLGKLTGTVASAPQIPANSILIAAEMLPSQLLSLDVGRLAGICLAGGGATSHVAIIAAAMDVPTLVAAGSAVLLVPAGTALVLNADTGWLYVDPPEDQLTAARHQLAQRRERRAADQLAAQRECRTADGIRIEVFANVGSVAETRAAVRNGAEGCGLLRTEFLFLDRQTPPDEAEQLHQYQQIAHELHGRPLTVRTLDIGGDKPIAYLPLPREDNPALGLRGVRTSLWKPDLLRLQLCAILKVRPVGQCRILLPMITDVGEIRTVRALLDELRGESDRSSTFALGAMIETPASAVMADRIAGEADFVSIGTNDLTQYTLAIDRGHPDLAARLDGLHPAVLRLIATVVSGARKHGRPVAVCGALASDPLAVPVLIGLGIHELSMLPSVIATMKALITTVTVEQCTRLAMRVLELETVAEVRELVCAEYPGGSVPNPEVQP
jgi:phosphoenolpyruvate-protein phosphotransferase